jgi:hypothetical protein
MATIPTLPHTFTTLPQSMVTLGQPTLASITCEVDARCTVGKGNKANHGLFRYATRASVARSILATLDDSTLASIAKGSTLHTVALATAVPGVWSKAHGLSMAEAAPIMARVATSALEVLAVWKVRGVWEWESVPCYSALASVEIAKRADAAAAKAAAPAAAPTLTLATIQGHMAQAGTMVKGRTMDPAWKGRKVA